MSSPRLSVLMPLYNGERFLPEALESVLSQTFTDFELLVVDDGSMDGSVSIVRSFSARDSRIRGFFLDKNVGIAAAMNRGLREARAPLVARMDCDDYCVPSRFAEQVSYMDKRADIYVLGCRSVNIDEHGNRIKGKEYNIAYAIDQQEIIELMGRDIYPLLHPSLMYRTARVLSLGGYREVFSIGEDLDLYERMLVRYGCVFTNLSNVLFLYRRYPASLTESNKPRKHHWIQALIRYSSDCVRQGLCDPLSVVKDLSFPPLTFSKDEFNIIELLFYLSMYRKLLSPSSSQEKNLRRLSMIRGKLSLLPKASKIRKLLDRRFFLLLLPVIPRDKGERRDFFIIFDSALFNRDDYFDSKNYSNFCIVVARGCFLCGEWKYFMRYMFMAFKIDFTFVLYFFYVRALAHLRK